MSDQDVERIDLRFDDAGAARQFCRDMSEYHLSNSMDYLGDDRPHQGAFTLVRRGGFSAIRTRNIFSFNYVRDERHIIAAPSETVGIHFADGDGAMMARQFGRDYVLKGGQAGIYVNTSPVTMQLQDGGRTTYFELPRALTANWRMAPEDVAVRLHDPKHPAVQILRQYAEVMLSAADIDAGAGQAMAIHMSELAGLWLGGLKDNHWRDRHTAPRQQARLAAIHAHINRHFAWPGLSAQDTGRVLGLSERLVQQVLSEAGISFSQTLARVRVENARARLEAPAFAAQSVAEIALACGFNDVSTFYRAFRARFGCAPSDMRPGKP